MKSLQMKMATQSRRLSCQLQGKPPMGWTWQLTSNVIHCLLCALASCSGAFLVLDHETWTQWALLLVPDVAQDLPQQPSWSQCPLRDPFSCFWKAPSSSPLGLQYHSGLRPREMLLGDNFLGCAGRACREGLARRRCRQGGFKGLANF